MNMNALFQVIKIEINSLFIGHFRAIFLVPVILTLCVSINLMRNEIIK